MTTVIILLIIVLIIIFRDKIRFLFAGVAGQKEWQCILLIDDDEMLIKTVRPILINNGYSVLTANSGEEGLSIIEKQKPDLLILDVILPGIKGRELCKKLKESKVTKDIPVVFLTAKDSPDDIRAEMDAGAETHLTKPVNAKELISTVNEILGKSG